MGDWDGTVRSTEATPFIPAGQSLWALSVEQGATRKADRDYSKRTSTPDGSPTNTSVYVAALLRRFANRAEWARTRAGDGRWKDVRAYGVDDIETWLEAAPVTHVWLSDMLQLHPTGLVAGESWWTSWSTASEPAIPTSLIVAGRQESVELLKSRLLEKSGLTTVKARTFQRSWRLCGRASSRRH